jgi:hypothetical protein
MTTEQLRELLPDGRPFSIEELEAWARALPALLDELDLQRGAARAQEERDRAATERVGEPPYGCDTSDHLADLLTAARKRIAELTERHAYLRDGIRRIKPLLEGYPVTNGDTAKACSALQLLLVEMLPADYPLIRSPRQDEEQAALRGEGAK